MSCNGSYRFWDISDFHMQQNALEDGAPIQIIYASRGPDYNDNKEYFYHFVVANKLTGDTINILTVANSYVDESSRNKTYIFASFDGELLRTYEAILQNPNSTAPIQKADTPDYSHIKKVARDPKYDVIAKNNHPTVIGSIMEFISGPSVSKQ